MTDEHPQPRWRFTLGKLPLRPDGSVDESTLDELAEALVRALHGEDVGELDAVRRCVVMGSLICRVLCDRHTWQTTGGTHFKCG